MLVSFIAILLSKNILLQSPQLTLALSVFNTQHKLGFLCMYKNTTSNVGWVEHFFAKSIILRGIGGFFVFN